MAKTDKLPDFGQKFGQNLTFLRNKKCHFGWQNPLEPTGRYNVLPYSNLIQ